MSYLAEALKHWDGSKWISNRIDGTLTEVSPLPRSGTEKEHDKITDQQTPTDPGYNK
jgi:hypothetical protein